MLDNNFRAFGHLIVSGSFFLVGACAGTPPVQPGLVTNEASVELGQQGYVVSAAEPYVLRPSDVVSVTVFREEDLSLEEVTISADGLVGLPLIGSIRFAGQTPAQIEAQIESQLGARFLRDPQVTVNVLRYESHQVTVEGAVEMPGLYDFRPGTRLSGALALAQGLSRTAAVSEVAVFRQSDQGMQIAKFDYAQVARGTMIDPILQPGDRIVIGTDGLSVFWQDALKSLPVFALFTNIGI